MDETAYYCVRTRPIDVTSSERAKQIAEAIRAALDAEGIKAEITVSRVTELDLAH